MSERTRTSAPSLISPIATPPTGPFPAPAGLKRGERAAAHARHRGGAVGLEDLGHDADRVRKVDLVREDGGERPLGERAVADLAPARAAQELRLARAEGREVVVQHELLVVLADQRIDLLLVRR